MSRLLSLSLAGVVAVATLAIGRPTAAQEVITTYYAPTVSAPVVADYPVTTAYYAPTPVTTYYAPTAPVTAYYAQRRRRITPRQPVTSYYAPSAVTSYYAATPYVAGYAGVGLLPADSLRALPAGSEFLPSCRASSTGDEELVTKPSRDPPGFFICSGIRKNSGGRSSSELLRVPLRRVRQASCPLNPASLLQSSPRRRRGSRGAFRAARDASCREWQSPRARR